MKTLKRIIPAVCFLAVAALAPSAQAEEGRLDVVATFSIIGNFAEAVGGDRISLKTLVGPDSDAHVYEPKPSDAIALARADVVLVNGLQFEGFLDRLIKASQTKADIAVLTKDAQILHDPKGGHYHYVDGEALFHATPNDPHAWQSVANAKVYVRNIAATFCKADRAGCPTFEANAEAYLTQLDALDAQIRKAVSGVPKDRRVAVVAHNAFAYFERDYGISFLAPQGVSTDAEASAADVAALIREIRARRASAVFGENISDTRMVTQIAAEGGLTLAGTLYSDALSPAGGPATGYIEMMRHNTQTLVTALTPD